MIRHILLIQFNEFAALSNISIFFETLDSITERVEGIASIEWGVNNSNEGANKGFTHCVMMTFIDEAARNHYLPHAAHDEIKKLLGPLLSDMIIIDYSI
ncbi:Dabb family protein [Marinomonas sp. M1K-6]|uniref:Dabb family protein n=1 Tax=Marinomonas profundi TaxID=2726122 RepID=A0A847R6M2_9GAMM|nr:Dabb family protein [Marinomonas profundi]NLQ17736.1 Dabb family protein [Marinomonas profundi]UDV04293.1 Dabb family protein [Marinomonas profundi]